MFIPDRRLEVERRSLLASFIRHAFQNEHAWQANVGGEFGLAYLTFLMILSLEYAL